MEEEREPRHVGPDIREHHLGRWPVPEQRLVDSLRGRLDLVREALVVGESLDERENDRRVLFGRRDDTNVEGRRHAGTLRSRSCSSVSP